MLHRSDSPTEPDDLAEDSVESVESAEDEPYTEGEWIDGVSDDWYEDPYWYDETFEDDPRPLDQRDAETLLGFLAARLAEETERVDGATDWHAPDGRLLATTYADGVTVTADRRLTPVPTRFGALVASARELLQLHRIRLTAADIAGSRRTLRDLVAAYAEHADYQQRWAGPSGDER